MDGTVNNLAGDWDRSETPDTDKEAPPQMSSLRPTYARLERLRRGLGSRLRPRPTRVSLRSSGVLASRLLRFAESTIFASP